MLTGIFVLIGAALSQGVGSGGVSLVARTLMQPIMIVDWFSAQAAAGFLALVIYYLATFTVVSTVVATVRARRKATAATKARAIAELTAKQAAIDQAALAAETQRLAELERLAEKARLAGQTRVAELLAQGMAQVDIGGHSYLISADPSYLAHIKDGFEPEMVQLFRTLTRGSQVVLDIGANIGCTAILFGGMAQAVHAFEPSRKTFAVLQDNVVRSGVGGITLHNIGLGADAGVQTLNVSAGNRAGAFVSDATEASVGHDEEQIVIRQLDEVVESLIGQKVDFIKIDTEGFEANVLRGATRTLAACRPVVVLELNHWCLNAYQRTSVPEFFEFLRSIFPLLFAVDGGNFLNLHDSSHSYIVMYQHILRGRFPNIVGAFDEDRLGSFRHDYHLQFFE